MAIRLWPQDYERKDHITKAEKGILRYAARNFQNGHMVVGIDPVGLSGERVKLGMYISPSEGLVTFSIYSGMICDYCKVITKKPKKIAPGCPAKSVRRKSPKSDMRVRFSPRPCQSGSGSPGLTPPQGLL